MITKSLIASIPHVWTQDPSLDKGPAFEAAWTEFIKTGEIAKLPIKDGQKPTVFTLGPLRRKALQRVYNTDGLERATEAVAYGLRNVADYVVDGRPVQLRWDSEADSKMGARLTNECLDEIYDPLLFVELSARIIDISHIDPLRGRG